MLSEQYLNLLKISLLEKSEQIIKETYQNNRFDPSPNPWLYHLHSILRRQKKVVVQIPDCIADDLKVFFNELIEKHLNNFKIYNLVLSDWIGDPFMSKVIRTFRNITQLRISQQIMGASAVKLVYFADWRQLRQVQFYDNQIGQEGAKILSKCNWSHLKSLKLKRHNLRNNGFCNLLKSNWPKLEQLWLEQNHFTPDVARMIPKHAWPKLRILIFQEADESEFTKALLKIVPLLYINEYFSIRYQCSRLDDAFAVFEHSVTSHCLAKTMNANTYFDLCHYAIYQDASFVSKGLMNIKEAGFLGFGN